MSFWPCPKTILDELRAGLELGAGIDLGSGDGRLSARLHQLGIHLLTADLSPPAELRLDAHALPFGQSTLGAILLANLLRHFGAPGRTRLLDELAGCLVTGGRIVVLEDDPRARTSGEKNYRAILDLLAEADPSRGPALDLDPVVADLPPRLDVAVDGLFSNDEVSQDPTAPLRWLASRGFATRPEFSALEGAVARDGIEYGSFRACVFRRV